MRPLRCEGTLEKKNSVGSAAKTPARTWCWTSEIGSQRAFQRLLHLASELDFGGSQDDRLRASTGGGDEACGQLRGGRQRGPSRRLDVTAARCVAAQGRRPPIRNRCARQRLWVAVCEVTCLSAGHIAFVLVTAKLEVTRNQLRRLRFVVWQSLLAGLDSPPVASLRCSTAA